MIKVDFNIDYHGLKFDYTAPASKLMLYLQEAAILHSEYAGLTMDWFYQTKRGWVIRDWDIAFLKPVKWADKLTVETFPAMFKGIMAHRGFICHNSAGEEVLKASSRWVFTDRLKLKPVRVEADMQAKYGELKPLPIETDFKITPLEGVEEAVTTLRVARHDTDTNRHANNISYLTWVTDMLTEEEYERSRISRLKISYLKQCVMGEEVNIRLISQDKYRYATITGEQGLLCQIYFELEKN